MSKHDSRKPTFYDLGLVYEIGLRVRFQKIEEPEYIDDPYRSLFVPAVMTDRLRFDCAHSLDVIESAFSCAESALREEPVDFQRLFVVHEAFKTTAPDTPVCDVAFALMRLVYVVAADWAIDKEYVTPIRRLADAAIVTTLGNYWSMARRLGVPILNVPTERLNIALVYVEMADKERGGSAKRRRYLQEAREALLAVDADADSDGKGVAGEK